MIKPSVMDKKPKTNAPDAESHARRLLGWYDQSRRVLPWRALPHEVRDSYRVWLSEIMLQQTTVQAVKPYFERFTALFPDVHALADAPTEQVMSAWAGLGYYSRARNLHACAKQVSQQHQGQFPADFQGLKALPGIGDYTANAILAIAFDKRGVVVDGNVERVISRLYRIEEPLPLSKPLIKAKADQLTPDHRPGDYAQAMMDLGATVCTPRSPSCMICPLNADCAGVKAGDAATFPRKLPKQSRKTRFGAAFLCVREDGAVLLRTRPEKGLLGGMSEIPCGPWLETASEADGDLDNAPLALQWTRLPVPVQHVFTHFPLSLRIYVARAPLKVAIPDGMRFTPRALLSQEALPNVMVKAITAGLDALGRI